MIRYIVLLLIIASVSVSGQIQKLNLASDVYPPFTNTSNKTSVALDLVSTALKRADIESYSSILPFGRVMTGIEANVFDGSAALWKTKEREEYLIYSEPYLENQLILVGLSGTDVDKGSIDELEGMTVGIVRNYGYGNDLFNRDNIHLVYGTDDQENLNKLIAGEIDVMLVDKLLIEYMLQIHLNEVKEKLAISSTPIIVKPLYLALQKDLPYADEIIESFNREIKNMISDGTYNRILNLNWISADIDGDGAAELVLNGDKAGISEPLSAYSVFSSTNIKNRNYVIDNKEYENWNSIPQKYKQKSKLQSSTDPENPGLIIKLQ
ncbi:transporter substrate-binding domain-containing protein [Mangrovivirga sp. M17]|uniref:Transporter substrate-binding domain-containing protein n=1 Tax=Mangrovivirga halotolerans TaxID=2993936 RepID=A0ABT3RMP0_9BACT|nr:transporter substrate-binding domain-containing protein [Mangrovivirga halotolerans]MCX2743081.1 transporter substrate-binding domain-containing protein [Mangrovivirga halotolerans]